MPEENNESVELVNVLGDINTVSKNTDIMVSNSSVGEHGKDIKLTPSESITDVSKILIL